MTSNITPFRQIGQAAPEYSGSPPTTPDLNAPDTVFVMASQEDIQDYVADLFLNATHQNARFEYDDQNNTLTFIVDSDIDVDPDVPADILDAITSLDGAIN